MSKILEIESLSVTLKEKTGARKLVSSVSFSIEKGQCIGILGESGSGKSMSGDGFANRVKVSIRPDLYFYYP